MATAVGAVGFVALAREAPVAHTIVCFLTVEVAAIALSVVTARAIRSPT